MREEDEAMTTPKRKAKEWIENFTDENDLHAYTEYSMTEAFLAGYSQAEHDTLFRKAQEAFKEYDEKFERSYELQDRGKK